MDFCCVDLGASGTRYRSNQTKGEMPNLLANNVAFLEPNEFVDLVPYDSQIESALEVSIQKVEGDSSYFPVHALIGSLAERYTPINERPSGNTHKYKQRITYLSAIVVSAISRLKENIGENLDLYVALPPIEVKTAKDTVMSQLTGRYIVNFPKINGGVTVGVNIVSVHLYEESYMATASYFFDLRGQLRDKAKDMLLGCVVSVDIGDSTTDLAVLKDGRYMEKSGQTYKIGAALARAEICNRVRELYGYDLPIDDANRTMQEGRLQMGNQYLDISEAVTESKRVLARMVVQEIQSYFSLLNMPLQTMRAVIVSGGGSLHSKYVDANGQEKITSEPMSSYITEYMSKICPGLAVVPYGENARMANVNGLALRAMIDTVNAAKSASVTSPVTAQSAGEA